MMLSGSSMLTATRRVAPCSMLLHKASHAYLSQPPVRGWHPSMMMPSSARGRLFGNVFREISLPPLAVTWTRCRWLILGHGLTSELGQ